MGSAASAFKSFFQRRIRRCRDRDRWVREDKKKLLPSLAKPKRTPAHHKDLPKRIDDQVYHPIQQQGLTRRWVEEPGWTIHDDIHRRQLDLLLFPSSSESDNLISSSSEGHIPSSSDNHDPSEIAELFDSMASWIREGTTRRGVNFYSLEHIGEKSDAWSLTSEEERRAKFDKIKWTLIDWDGTGTAFPRSDEGDNKATMTLRDVEKNTTNQDFEEEEKKTTVCNNQYLESDDEDDDEQVTNEDEQQNASGVKIETKEYELERFEVEINICNSADASWCENIIIM